MRPESPNPAAPAAPSAPQVVRKTDASAVTLAHTLLRGTATGSLATLDASQQWPAASLVTVASLPDGCPIILISELAGHTKALRSNPVCGLLLTSAGAGDPLAHPRISLQARVQFLDRNTPLAQTARRRFLNRHHKAALYADFGDFHFVKLDLSHASLNGGFGKAYELAGSELLLNAPAPDGFDAAEQETIESMNKDELPALRALARANGGTDSPDWRLTGIDPNGLDLIDRGCALRIGFEASLQDAGLLGEQIRGLAHKALQTQAD